MKKLTKGWIYDIRSNPETQSWGSICYSFKLTYKFMREFQDKVDWTYISSRQILSENFIREFQDKVEWYWISWNQKLSEGFLIEFFEKLYVEKLEDNEWIDPNVIGRVKLLREISK